MTETSGLIRGLEGVVAAETQLCDLDGAVALVLATTGKYRLPTPARLAHEYVNDIRRAVGAGKPIPE